MDKDNQLDLIYNLMNNLMNNGEFETIDILLKILTYEGIGLDSLMAVTFLTTSAWAKDKLPSRVAFFQKIKDLGTMDHLLYGLE